MSIRESAQPLTRTSRLPYETINFTEKPVAPAVDTVPSVNRLPELMVSHPALTFVQRFADKPVFSVLSIAQQHANTPVTLSTDEPDYFQLASDSRPAFSSTLTFIPPPSGAYVHVRYMAPKGCLHRAHLMIEAPYASTTVALEARTTGALSVMRNVLVSTDRAPAKQIDRVPSGSRWAAILAVVVISGLVYAGYTYQCQLFPSLCQEKTTESVRPKSPSPLSPVPTETFSGKTVHKELSNKVTKNKDNVSATQVSSRQTSGALANGIADKYSDNQSGEPRRTSRSRTSPALIPGEVAEPQTRRQEDAAPTKESELERELNRHF